MNPEQRIKSVICDQLGITEGLLHHKSRIVEDIGADSNRLLMMIAEEFGRGFAFFDVRLQTFGEVLVYVAENFEVGEIESLNSFRQFTILEKHLSESGWMVGRYDAKISGRKAKGVCNVWSDRIEFLRLNSRGTVNDRIECIDENDAIAHARNMASEINSKDVFRKLAEAIDAKYPNTYQHGEQGDEYWIEKPGVLGKMEVTETEGRLYSYIKISDTVNEYASFRSVGDVIGAMESWSIEKEWANPAPLEVIKEKKRLQKIVNGKAKFTYEAEFQEPDEMFSQFGMPDGFDAIVKGIDMDSIAEHFPRDSMGKIALKTRVLLDKYPIFWQSNYQTCLMATAPIRRKDPQTIVVSLHSIPASNSHYNWSEERWRWVKGETYFDQFDQELGRLLAEASYYDLKSQESASLSELERAALSILHLEAGEILAALELYQIGVDSEMNRLIGGQKIYPPIGRADQAWTDLVNSVIRSMALWKLADVLDKARLERRQWADQSKSRKYQTPQLVLSNFPGQTQIHKFKFALTGESDPMLGFYSSGSNALLYRNAYERPIEVDLIRYGIG